MAKRLAGPSGWTREHLNHYVPIPAGTGAVEFLTDWTSDHMFEVEKVAFSVAVAGTGAGATRTFRLLKGASTVVATGTIDLAGTATVGVIIPLTVTDDGKTNHFEPGDVLTLDVASGGTAFTAGALNAIVLLRTKPATLL